jgi:hypothetical protein
MERNKSVVRKLRLCEPSDRQLTPRAQPEKDTKRLRIFSCIPDPIPIRRFPIDPISISQSEQFENKWADQRGGSATNRYVRNATVHRHFEMKKALVRVSVGRKAIRLYRGTIPSFQRFPQLRRNIKPLSGNEKTVEPQSTQ